MITNPQNILFSSATASLKLATSGTSSVSCPGTATSVSVTVTIPHGAGTDALICQVGGVITDTTSNFVITPGLVTPYQTPDGQVEVATTFDAVNMYVTLTNSTAGSPTDATRFDFFYRVLVP